MAGGAPRHFNSLVRQISECEGSTMEAQMMKGIAELESRRGGATQARPRCDAP